MSDKDLVEKIVMFRNELERQKASMGITSLFGTMCSYYGEQHRTIESQQTKIESLLKMLEGNSEAMQIQISEIEKKDALIESQKEEIEGYKAITEQKNAEIAELREREYNHYPIVILDLETHIFKLQDDANTQEAITELAVKGFQMLKAMSSKDDIPAALYNTASWYLDEIANLEVKQNE